MKTNAAQKMDRKEEEEEQLRIITIPEDIITGEILTRLPVKSLLRFKCVYKKWRSLIGSNQFIQSHLRNYSSSSSPSHTTMIVSSFEWKLRFYSRQSLESVPVTPTAILDCPWTDRRHSLDTLIAGSCNGLLCILVDRRHFVLWNPATRESKKLPDFSARRQRGGMSRYGFGFDESSCDYNVYASFCPPLNFTTGKYHCTERVYSLKADSWGRVIRSPRESYPYDWAGRLVNGKLYWSRDPFSWDMLCFDLESERMVTLEQPSCIRGRFKPKIGVLDGCHLCVVCEYPNSKFDVWIRKDDDCWCKLATITASLYFPKKRSLLTLSTTPRCVLFLSDGSIMFNQECTLLVYDMREERFWFPNVVKLDCDLTGPELYTESLITLN